MGQIMITLTDSYTKIEGQLGYGVFKVKATNKKELVDFFVNHAIALNKKRFFDEEMDSLTVEIREEHRELMQTLAYRYNLILKREKLKSDKIEFLEQCSLEAIQAIIYATNCAPREMDCDQYARLILSAYNQFGPGINFSNRIVELLDCKVLNTYATAATQIELVLELLSTEELTSENENEDS
jgi:hypothetical protein